MVFQEIAQHRDVAEAIFHGVMNEGQPRSIGDTGDLEGLDESVVHGVIEDGIQSSGTLVLGCNAEVVPKHFSQAENASARAERTPEAAIHVFGG